MTFIGKLFGIKDHKYTLQAKETDLKIAQAERENDEKMQEILARHVDPRLKRLSGDKVMETWAGAMKMLRNQE